MMSFVSLMVGMQHITPWNYEISINTQRLLKLLKLRAFTCLLRKLQNHKATIPAKSKPHLPRLPSNVVYRLSSLVYLLYAKRCTLYATQDAVRSKLLYYHPKYHKTKIPSIPKNQRPKGHNRLNTIY